MLHSTSSAWSRSRVLGPAVVILLFGLSGVSDFAATATTSAASPVPFRPKPTVIVPKTGAPAIFGFRLTQGKARDTLLLTFFTRDKRYHFDPSTPFVIQLNMTGTIQVNPSVITQTEWPKAPAPLTLKVSGTEPGKRYPIAGAAGYNLCGPTAACKKVKTEIHYVVESH